MATTFIGIDPGTTGAITALAPGMTYMFDTPTDQVRVGKKNRSVYNQQRMIEILVGIRDSHPAILATIEEVHAMPKNGSQGNFSSGYGYGLWLGMLTSLRIPFQTVQPAKWKKALGVKRPEGETTDKAKKNADLMIARQLFPKVADQLNLAKHHGRADALLIAEYARRQIVR